MLSDSLETLGKPLRDLHKRFDEMTIPHRPALWRYCLRLTGSAWDAEDLVQETLTRAFSRLSQFWQPLEPRPYLFRIATNAWIDGLRRHRLALDSLEQMPDARLPATTEDPALTLAAMEALVRLLPPRQRAVLLLTQVFEFTAGEVAAMLGSSEGAVKAALHRARERLRSAREEEAVAAPARPEASVPPALLTRYLDAFNKRDPDAIVALLHTDVTSEIVGQAEEQGAEWARRYSLSEWADDPQPMWAEAGELDGRQAVFVYFRTAEHERALAWVITLESDAERLTAVRNYCFCPDLVRYAADLMGVAASLYGYSYAPPGGDPA